MAILPHPGHFQGRPAFTEPNSSTSSQSAVLQSAVLIVKVFLTVTVMSQTKRVEKDTINLMLP